MSKKKIRKNNCMRTTVRFNAEEFKKLNEMAEFFGMYIGQFLKKSYFEGLPSKVNMSWPQMQETLKSLRPIETNLNQIINFYKNSFMYGWHDEKFNELIEYYRTIYNWVTKGHLPPMEPWKV
jgi:hypothetical protein